MDEEARLHVLSVLQLPDRSGRDNFDPAAVLHNLPLPVCTATRQRQLKIGAQPADAKIAASHGQ
jgi:hypothetical protein